MFILIVCLAMGATLITLQTLSWITIRDQFIADDTKKIEQFSNSVEFITQDVKRVALSLAFDKSLQSFLKLSQSGIKGNSAQAKNELSDTLSTYVVQRDYLFNIVVLSKNDMIHSRATLSYTMDYWRNRTKEAWFTDYDPLTDKNYYSSAYMIESYKSIEPVIAHVLAVPDEYDMNKTLGYIIINIMVKNIAGQMDSNRGSSDAILWYDRCGKLIHFMPSEAFEKASLIDQFQTFPAADSQTLSKNGICNVVISLRNQWTFVAYTLNKSIYAKTLNGFPVFIFITLFIVLGCVVWVYGVVSRVVKPIMLLSNTMQAVEEGNRELDDLEIHTGDEIEALKNSFVKMLRSIQAQTEETLKNIRERKIIELNLLQAQINPHYLYNTLYAIKYLVKDKRNEDASNALDAFIRVLQTSVRIGEEGMYSTIHAEIELVKNYFSIQSYRYDKRFGYSIWVEPSLNDMQVPRAIIQPVVDNALVHGILSERASGFIDIKVISHSGNLVISVTDNGIGMEDAAIRQLLNNDERSLIMKMKSIGIPNVHQRIRYLYGEGYGVSIESKVFCYTTVKITLPIDDGAR